MFAAQTGKNRVVISDFARNNPFYQSIAALRWNCIFRIFAFLCFCIFSFLYFWSHAHRRETFKRNWGERTFHIRKQIIRKWIENHDIAANEQKYFTACRAYFTAYFLLHSEWISPWSSCTEEGTFCAAASHSNSYLLLSRHQEWKFGSEKRVNENVKEKRKETKQHAATPRCLLLKDKDESGWAAMQSMVDHNRFLPTIIIIIIIICKSL